jgi:undecaprenyl-diphosphatase
MPRGQSELSGRYACLVILAGVPADRWVGRTGLFALALVLALVLFSWLRRHRAMVRARAAAVRGWFVPALSLGAVAVFAKIADDVQDRETTGIDRAVSLRFHELDSPAMDTSMRAFTFLGSFPVILVVVIVAALWRLRRGDKRGAALVAAVAAFEELLNLVLKEAFRRTRPSLFEEIATLHSYSFPSGHAMTAAAVYGAIAVLVARARPERAAVAFAVSGILSFSIGASRIYLGVHWLTDVLAGWSAGVFVLLVGVYLLARADARQPAGS